MPIRRRADARQMAVAVNITGAARRATAPALARNAEHDLVILRRRQAGTVANVVAL
jgi:hypothetical protein